jgi:hypothetical protein
MRAVRESVNMTVAVQGQNDVTSVSFEQHTPSRSPAATVTSFAGLVILPDSVSGTIHRDNRSSAPAPTAQYNYLCSQG